MSVNQQAIYSIVDKQGHSHSLKAGYVETTHNGYCHFYESNDPNDASSKRRPVAAFFEPISVVRENG